MRRSTITQAVLAGLLTVLAVAAPSAAQQPDDELRVRIRETTLDTDGSTRLLVSVTGAAADGSLLGAGNLEVREDGVPIDGITVTPLLESEPESVGVVLAVDVSGSTLGRPLAAAQAAAVDFADEVTATGVSVGLVSFGPVPELLVPATTDAAPLRRGIESLVAEGETALYDGVVLAAEALAGFDGLRSIVVFSDGADTVSTATLEDATAAALAIEASVSTVALATDALDPAAIEALATGTDGRVIQAADSESLAAAFDTAAAAIASQYVITYTAPVEEGSELDLTVVATIGEVGAQDAATIVNPRKVQSSGPVEARIAEPGTLAEPWALWAGAGAAFLALFILVVMLGTTVQSEGEGRRLERSLHAYTAGGLSRARRRDLDPTQLSRRAGNLVDRLPKPAGFDVALQRRIDQAAWPLRASEFVAIQIAAAFGAALLAWALTGSLLFPIIGLAVGWFLPKLVLDRRVQKRSSDFMEQLPDTLGLLAGSLKAGYGLVQAIDTVVRESPAPTSEEFGRVLTETRLGLALSDALEGMAERTDSEDFGWVVMAINIQAEVGGNLAHLLETIASTLREREQLRRQVRTLSAEGKLSAWVLIGLVPAMGLYMFAVNQAYVSLLWTTSMGRALIAVGSGLMLLGIFGIKKTITIDI
jgi:tight adherence protein B